MLKEGMKVKVYRNITRGCFSVVDAKTNLVIGYTDEITLKDVTFHVGQKGRERVNEEKVKNVHAHAKGYVTHEAIQLTGGWVWYNPYHTETFEDETGKAIYETEMLLLKDGRMYK